MSFIVKIIIAVIFTGIAHMRLHVTEYELDIERVRQEVKINLIRNMRGILNPDNFYIKLKFKTFEKYTIDDSIDYNLEFIEKILKKYPDEFRYLGYYVSLDTLNQGKKEYRAVKYLFDIYVDSSVVEINNNLEFIIKEIITGEVPSEFYLCNDCVTLHSVDSKYIKKLYNGEDKGKLSLSRDDIYDNSWAVIIGIDKYKYSKQLNYAVKDAEAVKELLISKFDYPEENIRYLTDKEATLSNIKFNLGEVATLAGENDRILVFYSGHGETLSGKDGTETGYIIPYEGKQNNPYATGLVMDEILRTCQMSNAKHMLFLMDACYSGLMTENMKGLSKPEERGYLNKVANESSRQIITAGGSDEQVIERDEWQHSAFTKNLLAGLDDWESDTDNDGYVTADELGTYLRISVTEDSDNMQTPQKGRFRNSGGGEFVFFSNHNAINKNIEDKLTDEKLDYLISEMEELKSQKSSDEDIVLEKTVDGEKGWYEKYGYEKHAIGFLALEDMYQITFYEDISKKWLFNLLYMQFGNNIINNHIISRNTFSMTANVLGVRLGYKYYITDDVTPYIGIGAAYMMTSWEDTEQKTSGDKNVLVFAVSGGVGIYPFQFEQPFPMNVGIQIDVFFPYFPTSFAVVDGIVTSEDWQIAIIPLITFSIGIPK
jgi:opacity protein-like surface antigen/predicted phosphatase